MDLYQSYFANIVGKHKSYWNIFPWLSKIIAWQPGEKQIFNIYGKALTGKTTLLYLIYFLLTDKVRFLNRNRTNWSRNHLILIDNWTSNIIWPEYQSVIIVSNLKYETSFKVKLSLATEFNPELVRTIFGQTEILFDWLTKNKLVYIYFGNPKQFETSDFIVGFLNQDKDLDQYTPSDKYHFYSPFYLPQDQIINVFWKDQWWEYSRMDLLS